MAQIRESCFRVINVNLDDVDLVDMHSESPSPVSIEKHHSKYTDGIEDKICSLEPGNVIKAIIQSEDVLWIDGIWRVLDFETVDSSIISYIERIPIEEISNKANELGYQLLSRGGIERRTEIKLSQELVGYLSVRVNNDGEAWSELGPTGVNSRKQYYGELSNVSTPPYKIIHMKTENEDCVISYYVSLTKVKSLLCGCESKAISLSRLININ